MNVKRYLKKCAEKDKLEILQSEKSQSILRSLIEKGSDKENQTLGESSTQKCIICPDCGSALFYNSCFGRFMHKNCERLNCWYQANEFGECVDNNQMRAARIAKFNGENFNETKKA